MSEVEQNITGSEKAGNYKKIIGKLTIINWERRTITHNYSINTCDSEGDLLKEDEHGNVPLSGDQFDYWINQAMKDETLTTILDKYNETLTKTL